MHDACSNTLKGDDDSMKDPFILIYYSVLFFVNMILYSSLVIRNKLFTIQTLVYMPIAHSHSKLSKLKLNIIMILIYLKLSL